MWGYGYGQGVPAEDLEGTGVKDVEADTFGNKEGGWGRVRLGMGMEMSSWTPLTTGFLHPQRVQSVPGQACPGTCGGWGAGEGGGSSYPPPSVPEQPHPPEP